VLLIQSIWRSMIAAAAVNVVREWGPDSRELCAREVWQWLSYQ